MCSSLRPERLGMNSRVALSLQTKGFVYFHSMYLNFLPLARSYPWLSKSERSIGRPGAAINRRAGNGDQMAKLESTWQAGTAIKELSQCGQSICRPGMAVNWLGEYGNAWRRYLKQIPVIITITPPSLFASRSGLRLC